MAPKKAAKGGKVTAGKDAKAAAAAMLANAKDVKPKKIPPPPACFNFDDLQRFKTLFKEFDEEGQEQIPLEKIPTMLRVLGFNVKGDEIRELFAQFLEDDAVEVVEFHEFLFMIEAKSKWGDDREQTIIDAIAFLGHDDAEKPTQRVNIETLREELMNWGEPLSDLEWVDLPKVAMKEKCLIYESPDFDYGKFVDIMNSRDVKYNPEPINFFKLDQKTLAEMAFAKAAEERAEEERKEQEKLAREEARRQRLIEAGLIFEDP